MEYPPGKAPFAILLMAIISGILLLIFPGETAHGNLSVWTFAQSHFDSYNEIIPQFEREYPGTRVNPQYVSSQATTSRLRAAFYSGLPTPDLVDVEISSAGTFFLGPLNDIGFVDLTEQLEKTGWKDKIVKSRFAPYTSRGHIFGLPHDVHPVVLAYRRDIFEENGIDAEKLTTWDAFITEGRKLMKKLNKDAHHPDHYLLELSDTTGSELEVLLFQRDGGYFDQDGNVRMDDEIAVKTMLWYVPLVAGPERVANILSAGAGQGETQSVETGYLLAFLMPDWRSYYFQTYNKGVSGKMALMPLPAFEPGGRRTSTRGGTMMGITKRSIENNPAQFEKSWNLALKLYYDIPSRIKQFKTNNILPPLREAWKDPALAAKNPYWSNQPLGTLYASLADQTPAQYSSPYITLTKNKLSESVCDCVEYYKDHGMDGFEAFVRQRLKQAADEVRLQMSMNPYQGK